MWRVIFLSYAVSRLLEISQQADVVNNTDSPALNVRGDFQGRIPGGGKLVGPLPRKTAAAIIVAVIFILSAIALNTTLAIQQTQEQRSVLTAVEASSDVKHNLDELQQLLLDEHSELYTRISTLPFYKREPYAFPLGQVNALEESARLACGGRVGCVFRLSELDRMTRQLAERSSSIGDAVELHPGSVKLNDGGLTDLDAFFYSVLAKLIEIRVDSDAVAEKAVTNTSSDSQRTSDILLGSALFASLILLVLLFRLAQSSRRLRDALLTADRARTELFRSKQTLEYVLDNISQGIAWKDSTHRYGGGNEVFARDAGLNSREELVGLTDEDLRWGNDPEVVRAEDSRVMSGSLAVKHHEREVKAVDGSNEWISETKLPLRDPDGVVVGVLIAYENITARREAELALRLQGRALDASVNGIVISEPRNGNHVVLYANSAFEQITGYTHDEVAGRGCNELFGLEGEPEKWDSIRAALDGNSEANVTLLCVKKTGEKFWNNILVAPVKDDSGHVTHHVGVMSDVSALVNYQAELRRQARFDALTGLPNRAALDERLEGAIARAREAGSEVSVLFLDLDRFKQVNDSLGHKVGDALLAQVAKRLLQVVRTSDLVARYGGDEFLVVAEHSDALQLVPTVKRIIASMTEPLRVAQHDLYVEVSVGISTFPHDGLDADTLIRNADAAMYLAKDNGRNGYQYYRPELNRAAANRLTLSTKLRRAIRAKSMSVAFQPQIDMATGSLCGAEALARWTDDEWGVISPAVFVPLAEESDLIVEIGEWVLHAACAQARAWLDVGVDCVRMSVNVSPVQLERSNLVETVRKALDATRLPATMLELEVTEGTLMRNIDAVAQVLRELRALGVKIAIDDFGTGYSSLSYLKRFSVDRLKIDKAFIQEIGTDTESDALTLAVIAMAGALNFDIIAEGVETEEQQDFLVNHGCTAGQGFLFSAPVAASHFENFARTNQLLGQNDRRKRIPAKVTV